MKTEIAAGVTRAQAIASAAAQWSDRASQVRARAREALAGGIWPSEVVEAALDNALWDLDEPRALALIEECSARAYARTLVVLPGNIIGPAIQAAFCAAVADAPTILKVASAERHLAQIVSRQFDEFGAPLRGLVEARYWRGGDLDKESAALSSIDNLIVFGEDATIEQIRGRAPHAHTTGYGESYSIGYVHADADVGQAAAATAADVCLFDQRGCMSPQTIYVAGDTGKALLFTRALAGEIRAKAGQLPRAAFEPDEGAQVADFVRRLGLTAVRPLPHGLDTLVQGPLREGVPEFAVALEPFGQPTCAGFGRIVVVKHAPNARDVATQLKHFGRPVETIGLAPQTPERDRSAFTLSGARRLCELGEMQRPPFGYRPEPRDFQAA
jgi:hypothetical protein